MEKLNWSAILVACIVVIGVFAVTSSIATPLTKAEGRTITSIGNAKQYFDPDQGSIYIKVERSNDSSQVAKDMIAEIIEKVEIFAMVKSDGNSFIVSHIISVFVMRIEPHHVKITGNPGHPRLERLPSIFRNLGLPPHGIHTLVIAGIDIDLAVIKRPAVVPVHIGPGFAPI